MLPSQCLIFLYTDDFSTPTHFSQTYEITFGFSYANVKQLLWKICFILIMTPIQRSAPGNIWILIKHNNDNVLSVRNTKSFKRRFSHEPLRVDFSTEWATIVWSSRIKHVFFIEKTISCNL